MNRMTKQITGRSTSLVIALWLVALSSTAQSNRPGRGMRNPVYDASTETTIKGTVTDVQKVEHRNSGIHLSMKSENGPVEVHLGPSWYIDSKHFSFAKSDEISVTGSLLKSEGTRILIAREVVKDGKTLTLRDKQGVPLWSRSRQR